MKSRINLFIISAFFLQTTLATFPITENGSQALNNAIQANKNFMISTYATSAAALMMELVTQSNAAPLPVEHKSKKETDNPEKASAGSLSYSFSDTSAQGFRLSAGHSNAPAASDISNMLYFWDMVRFPPKIPDALIFLTFLFMFYLLPRGAIDPSIIMPLHMVR